MTMQPTAVYLRRLADESGSAVLEMALMMPLFLMMLFGTFGFSIALFGYSNATFAARAAARYASLHSLTSLSPATVNSVQAAASPYLAGVSPSMVSTQVTYTDSNQTGQTVRVRVQVRYNLLLPFYNGANMLTISSTAQRTITR
jgi:Flp pilus assembly protein TadG